MSNLHSTILKSHSLKSVTLLAVLVFSSCGIPTKGVQDIDSAMAKRPNILLIVADDLGYADVGFNGSKEITTPELDRLSGGGIVFTSAYVPHPFCGPSRAAILTGQYAQKIGAQLNLPPNSSSANRDNMGVPVKHRFLSKHLHNAGYRTGMIGKWHLGAAPKYHPNQRGFDFFYGFLNGGHDYFPEAYRAKYQRQTAAGGIISDYVLPLECNGEQVRETEYLTDAFSREAVNFVNSVSDSTPFFLFLSYNAPHVPLEAKEEDLNKFKNIKNKERRTYAAMVYALDRGVGRVVAALKKNGQYEHTLIVFISDNGGKVENAANNSPLKGGKGQTWEGGYRVPMFFHWPEKITAGKTFNFPVTALDFYPTFAGLANAELLNNQFMDGKNIWLDLVSGTNPHNNSMIYALRYRHGSIDVGARKDDWKVTKVANEPWKLYNIKNDISEANDLSREYPERLKQMVDESHAWTQDFIRPLWYNSENEKNAWREHNMPNYPATFTVE